MELTSTKRDTGHAVNAHEFINLELEFDLNKPYTPIDWGGYRFALWNKIKQLLMNSLKKVTMCKLGDLVIDWVGFKDVQCALVTLNNFGNKSLLMLHLPSRAIRHFKKEIRFWHGQESHQITFRFVRPLCWDVWWHSYLVCIFILHLYKCYCLEPQSHISVTHVSVTKCLCHTQIPWPTWLFHEHGNLHFDNE